jgi:hypothetical protein
LFPESKLLRDRYLNEKKGILFGLGDELAAVFCLSEGVFCRKVRGPGSASRDPRRKKVE